MKSEDALTFAVAFMAACFGVFVLAGAVMLVLNNIPK
jgi:hypothetical protein